MEDPLANLIKPKSDNHTRWTRDDIIGVSIIVLAVLAFVFFSVENHIQNNRCKSLATFVANQVNGNEPYGVSQNGITVPTHAASTYNSTYNNCVASESLF